MKPRTAPGERGSLADLTAALVLALGAGIENARYLTIRSRRAWIAAVPIVIVNYVAFRAQLRFWQSHLGRTDAILVSVALESIAIYLAWQAHLALVSDDSALRLRLAAYGMALVIGALNYSHYAKPGGGPTVAAVTFGMMSVISPWLWSIHSRRGSRDRLRDLNRIEGPAVRLGGTRWFFHAYRCVRVMRAAAWHGENRPAEAIALVYPPDEPEATAPVTPPSGSRAREPRAATARAARSTVLAAARPGLETTMVQDLIRSGKPFPGRNELALDPALAVLGSEATRRRAARRILDGAQAELDGHVRVNGS